MHRQIAGKLTGPVTKWIVLVAVIVLTGILGSLGGKLADVKNNEQSVLGPVVRRVDEGVRPAVEGDPGPQRHPAHSSPTTAPAA